MPGTGGGQVRSCVRNRCRVASIGTSTTTGQRYGLQSIRCARLCRGVCRRVRGDGPEAGDSAEGEQRRKPKVTGSNPVRPPLDSSEGEHRSSQPSVAGSTPAPSTMTCHVMTSEREFHTRTRSARRAVLDTLRRVAMPGPPQQTRRRARVLEARGPVRNARNRTPSRRRRPDCVSAPGARPLRDGAARAVSTFFAEFAPLHRAHPVRCARMAVAGSDPPRRHHSTDRTTSAKKTRRECRDHPQHVLDQAGRDR